MIARKYRNTKDEFRLNYLEGSVVTIQNHKFGGYLSTVPIPSTTANTTTTTTTTATTTRTAAAYKAWCVKDDDQEEETDDQDRAQAKETEQEALTQVAAKAAAEQETNETLAVEEDYGLEQQDDAETAPDLSDKEKEEDRKWCFIKGAHGSNGVMMKSLVTGENLIVDQKGNVVFCNDDTEKGLWNIECVTGELCFLSNANPGLEQRLRCDMAGLLGLTDAWKGWEVFRFMEASHGYVKISSWMHSQWLLCSYGDGRVSTCSHADSFHDDEDTSKSKSKETSCSKWAIEKSPKGDGVIIRSKAHGRLLSIHNGTLRTYLDTPSENQDKDKATNENVTDIVATMSEEEGNQLVAAGTPKQKMEESSNNQKWWNKSNSNVSNNSEGSGSGGDWWKNMQNSFRGVGTSNETENEDAKQKIVVPQADTLVWQVEAAHLQTYYFSTAPKNPKDDPIQSIGPFPQVTPNLRKTDKIQLMRQDNGSTRLYLVEQKRYIACSVSGTISLVGNSNVYIANDNVCTEWVMDKSELGGNVFRSKNYEFYLSYKDVIPVEEQQKGGRDKLDDKFQSFRSTDKKEEPKQHGHFGNLFGGGKPEKTAELVGTETIGTRGVWRLEPCMPRAVSSEKIKTFALGTGIAVGTTIAMPFALAGVGALLGAVGAEVGIVANMVAVGLTGAEALASVGAIGATAYIVFRPEDNSLTDDHQNDDEEKAERAWSKRPFSNWRNW